ncbi:Zn-ribbon domain-containing OB-fold protein [Metabacillus rhizolycopersici]|uniref:Zn-ribbon domain-containing OB-fold protein n=1 Tax=Metabacillus rhizolycopersici TaxID=2875709 RepID=A0ABS7UWK6_9BACI|nr:Zn-ribbon domain-containing OB-fold protein [Metabacillus rhizolycopersici]MBZ5752686.1 Zn-ribbon domain-containing OB-fold protein [Metabacillus rhizolycopersici]
MQESLGKNFPQPTVETARFWEGCRVHELIIQKCSDCHNFQFYPRLMCTNCTSRKVEWMKASGRGKVMSFTIVHRAISKAYLSQVPYVIAIIELEEGPTMMSNIVQCEPKAVEIGMEVEVVFENWSDTITMPQFSPFYKENEVTS